MSTIIETPPATTPGGEPGPARPTGKRVEAWTYNGTVPGPTMQVDPGDKVRVVLRNELPESTVIRFHGMFGMVTVLVVQ